MDATIAINAPLLALVIVGMGYMVETIPANAADRLCLICAAEVAFNVFRLGAAVHSCGPTSWSLGFIATWALLAFRAGYRSNLQPSPPWHSS